VTGISLPGRDCLPPGPHRALVEALHELYEGAGLPALRKISEGIARSDFPDTVSYDRVGSLLHGTTLPGWGKVECVVRQFAAMHNPRLNADQQAARFLQLWLAADRARKNSQSHSEEEAVTPLQECRTEPGLPVVRGRGEIIDRLLHAMGTVPGGAACPRVLYGEAGIGKSTIAGTVAAQARHERASRRLWWVCAADEGMLARDLASMARDLGVGEADWSRLGTRSVADLCDVADRVWAALEDATRDWLLVIDNADDPQLLGPQDGTGWVRAASHGMVLITTRNVDRASWPEADLIRVDPLPPDAAAQVLTDLAPRAGDSAAAQRLAQRLGYVPLALRIAGTYLREDFGTTHTFDEYRQALEHSPVSTPTRRTVGRWNPASQTPELSLDALSQAGFPQARPLLWLLACYAPSSLILEEILTGGPVPGWSPRRQPGEPSPLGPLLDPGQTLPANHLAEYSVTGVQELQAAGLIERSKSADGRKVIQVHASIADSARAVMENGPRPSDGPAPSLVRSSAAAAVCVLAARLDTGSAEHWPYFRLLTPHVEELLVHTAAQLDMRARRELLTCLVRCIAAHIWSKAEQRAEQIALRGMALASQLGCRDRDVYLRLRHVHAQARREQGWFTEAAGSFQDVLARQQDMEHGTIRLDTLRTQQQLAWTKGRLGRWAEAEAGLRQVISMLDDRRRRYGMEDDAAHVLRLHVRCMTNWCVGQQGRWAEAEQGYRQLVTDREELLGPDHPDTLDARYNIGKALAWQGRWTAAENEWRHTAADRAQAMGPLHPDTLLARQLELYAGGHRAWLDGDRNGCWVAAAGLETILGVQRDKRGENHRETLDTRAFLAALRGDYSPDMMWPEDLPRPGAD
jgi:NB-ARC domain/Tetratricopeptide repeat